MRGSRSLAAAALLVGCTLVTSACTGPAAPTASPSPTASASGASTASASPTSSPTASASAAPTVPAPAPTTPAPPPTTVAPAPGTVDVAVTFAGWNATTSALEVGAYAEVVTTGASCTLRLTGPGGRTVEVSSAALADAATTVCELLAVPRADLVAGTWSGTVDFASTERSGQAAVPPMEVP